MLIELLQNVLYPMADIGERPGEASSPTPSPPPPFQGRKKVSLRPGIPLSQGLDDRSPLISLLPAVIIGLEGIAIKSYLSMLR